VKKALRMAIGKPWKLLFSEALYQSFMCKAIQFERE